MSSLSSAGLEKIKNKNSEISAIWHHHLNPDSRSHSFLVRTFDAGYFATHVVKFVTCCTWSTSEAVRTLTGKIDCKCMRVCVSVCTLLSRSSWIIYSEPLRFSCTISTTFTKILHIFCCVCLLLQECRFLFVWRIRVYLSDWKKKLAVVSGAEINYLTSSKRSAPYNSRWLRVCASFSRGIVVAFVILVAQDLHIPPHTHTLYWSLPFRRS